MDVLDRDITCVGLYLIVGIVILVVVFVIHEVGDRNLNLLATAVQLLEHDGTRGIQAALLGFLCTEGVVVLGIVHKVLCADLGCSL